ncbi:MAG: hypothetical protein J6Y92_10315 [Lentisphaeria bacterium]|nr:hypothetical protein [Lentisphaeria bacterium]
MNNKTTTVIVAVCGIILVVFLAVATVRIMQDRKPEPPAVSEVEQPEEKPAPVRRHGPKVKKKVDIASTFSDWGGAGQDNAQDGEPHKELHEQTPEEAVESLWQGLDTYRELSDEDKAKANFALGFVTLIVNAIGDNAGAFVQQMNDQQRAEAIANAQTSLININAMEMEVAPDMTEEELNVIGGTLQAVRNLNVNLLNALQ